MSFISKGYQDLWKAIIRPPRENYLISELGPAEFALGGRNFRRTDFQLRNSLGLNLECSHFEPIPEERPAECLPCVIYLHGNCSSRLEALAAVPELLPCSITILCFDMSGSGLSEGEYISLGWFERDDLACVVEHLRSCGTVSCIGLWGRSMGAATALLHGDRDPSIAGMVLDSPFSNLKLLCEELARSYVKVPGFVLSMAMSLVRKTIRKKAKFDVKDLNPIDYVDRCFIPAYFVAANDDTFIKPTHTHALHDKYAGDKNLMMVEGDHNSARPQFMLDSVAIFFHNTLQCELIPPVPKKKRRVRHVEEFHPAQHEFPHALEFQGGLEMSEEDMIRMAIEESLKESNESL